MCIRDRDRRAPREDGARRRARAQASAGRFGLRDQAVAALDRCRGRRAVIHGVAAAASDPAASEAASAVLQLGAGAVDALIAAFFVAAGRDPGVLLAPAVAL